MIGYKKRTAIYIYIYICRTEEEFKKGHVDVENALNIPYVFKTPKGNFTLNLAFIYPVYNSSRFSLNL